MITGAPLGSNPPSRGPVVAVVGPTATGKSDLAVALAHEFNGEIVSCDSVAVYRELEIGTAKPTREERALIQHHMIDIVSPDEACTAGDYSRQARAALREIADRRIDQATIDEIDKSERERAEREALEWAAAEVDDDLSKGGDD